MQKTNAPGYFVNDKGIVVNDDELAWMRYKAEREATRALMDLVQEVKDLKTRVSGLERKLNETTSND